MNAKQLATQECANYSNGDCLGVMINSDLTQYIDTMLYGKPCCVNNDRCHYFEEILIPLVRLSIKQNKVAMEKAVMKYEKNILESISARYCKQCQKPYQANNPRVRLCTQCRENNKRRSWRKSKRMSRCPK